MAGGKKMEQAKKALTFCLENLNETDRFEVIRFSTETEPFFDKLVPANKENVDKAQDFVDGLKAIGGTAIERGDEARRSSCASSRRRHAEPAVRDRLPHRRPADHRRDAARTSIVAQHRRRTRRRRNIRIFSFGIGTDVNTHLLDRIADGTNAFSQYVLPDEDMEVKLSNFYTKIKEPVLSNVQVAFSGPDIKTSQLYPGRDARPVQGRDAHRLRPLQRPRGRRR